MRAAPALTVTVCRFGLWRGALLTWWLAIVTATSAWAWQQAMHGHAAAWLVAACAALLSGLAAIRSIPTEPVTLKWDQQCWHVDNAARASQEVPSGEVDVMMDLGFWLMLRFIARTDPRRRWIAVQRSGLEDQWHALRCAVYSPRPAAGRPPNDPSHRASPGASQRASTRTDPAA